MSHFPLKIGAFSVEINRKPGNHWICPHFGWDQNAGSENWTSLYAISDGMLLWKSWHIERFRGAKVLKCTALEHRERSIAEVRARTSNESERFHFRQHTICWLCASFFSPLVRVLLYLLWLAVLHACWYWCYSLVACGCVCVCILFICTYKLAHLVRFIYSKLNARVLLTFVRYIFHMQHFPSWACVIERACVCMWVGWVCVWVLLV